MLDCLNVGHGVRNDLAHNMTVTPRHLGEVARMAAEVSRMGYGMPSFRPLPTSATRGGGRTTSAPGRSTTCTAPPASSLVCVPAGCSVRRQKWKAPT